MTTRFFTRTMNDATKQPSSSSSSDFDDIHGKKWNINYGTSTTTTNGLFWNTIKYSTSYNGHLLNNRSLFNDDTYNTTAMFRTLDNVANNSNSNTTPMILACSATIDRYNGSRTLCCDRKGWVDHLSPQPLAKNTVRIVITQVFQVLSQYFTEQLKFETELDKKVTTGETSKMQATYESSAWTEREWKIRIDSLPNRICISLAKYHAVTLVMRLYEYIASLYTSIETLDHLTLDTLDCAKRTGMKYNNKTTNVEYCTEILPSVFHANIIVYLADYSVHQVILLYGYYMYVQARRNSAYRTGTSMTKDSDNNSGAAIEIGSLALSYFKKSTLLFFQRGIWLVSASIFGSIGSSILPGWGTMAGLGIGETIGCNITDLLIPVDVPYGTIPNNDTDENDLKKAL